VGQKHRDEAIKAYEAAAQTALRTRGPALAEVYAELGPLYVEAGNLDQAVTVLDSAVKEAGQTPVLAVAQRNLAIAWYRRGVDRMKDGKQAEGALEDLGRAAALAAPPKDASAASKPALTPKEVSQVQCAAALAALKSGKAQAAQEGFARAVKEGGCQWKPPYDKVGTEFFGAYALYRDTQSPARRDAAAKTFQRLLPKATGAFQSLLRDLIRSSYELEAYDYWVRGDEGKAAAALKNAAQMAAKGGKGDRRNLDHNLAVIDIVQGKTGPAEKALEELGQRPPEALVNLGILADRQGDGKRALELYKKAVDRGAHAPKLREWIDVKERLLAGGGGAK
jgi:tetratricopeptide (TPR) repeat protein